MSVGTQIAGYRLEELVGQGGMGVVYRAHDVALERSVALKLLSPSLAENPAFRERFLVESRLAASLDHPNVVPIYDAGEVEDQLYLAMRYVEGSDLKKLLKEEGPLGSPQAIAISAQVANALDAAHARGLVHRDVKPSNVLLDETGHAYLADFGLTRRLSEHAPAFDAGLSLGTPAYVAPEQIEGKDVDGRADQYSLACLFYECLVGEPPFSRTSEAAMLFGHLEEAPPTYPGLDLVLATALAKNPSDRYESCSAFVSAARAALGLEPKRTRWPVALAGVGAALIGAALLAFFLTRGGGGLPVDPQADSLVMIDPTTNTVSKTMPVGRLASGVAASGRFVWVTNAGDRSVWRVTPSSGAVLKLRAQGTPTDVSLTQGQAVVANGPEGSVDEFDAESGASDGVTQLTAGSAEAIVLSNSAPNAWFGAPNDRRVGAIAGEVIPTGAPTVDVKIPQNRRNLLTSYTHFNGLAVSGRDLWIAGDPFGRVVWRVDIPTRRIVATIPVPGIPAAIAADAGGAWLTTLLDDTVLRIDARDNQVAARIPVPRGAYAIDADDRSAWVIGALDRTLSRIDRATNRVASSIKLDKTPIDVAVDADGVWVVEGNR